jgi:hypothetical protein
MGTTANCLGVLAKPTIKPIIVVVQTFPSTITRIR